MQREKAYVLQRKKPPESDCRELDRRINGACAEEANICASIMLLSSYYFITGFSCTTRKFDQGVHARHAATSCMHLHDLPLLRPPWVAQTV